MRVAYVKAPFQFEIREMAIPEPGENQVLLEVKACAVCGTDMHTAAADADHFQSFGHEITGVVVIAKGCGTGSVDLDILNAVQVLFDVPAHKIKIMKMK